MFKGLEFHGKATVNERGQIVLPASVRKQCNIEAGESIFVFSKEKDEEAIVVLVKENSFSSMMSEFEKRMKEMLALDGDDTPKA